MSRRRFYAPPSAFVDECRAVLLASEEARHLRDVLRLGRGDEVFVFDGEGREYACVVEEIKRDGARLGACVETSPARPESPLRLTLAVALLKGEKFDLLVQKATELGVARITPIVTKLADVRLRNSSDAEHRRTRWQRIAIEAAKQSGRARVPLVEGPVAFDELVHHRSSSDEWRVMFAERDGQGLTEMIKQTAGRLDAVTALVGSEGGWTDEEIARARACSWQIVTLGGRTLRAETAGIVACALLQHLLGDLS